MLMAARSDDLKRQVLRDLQRREGGTIVGDKLFPLRESMSSLVRQDDVVCSVEGSWFAIATEPREEEHVAHGLRASGVLPYLPVEPKQERHGRGMMRIVYRPFITGYVFGKCILSNALWHGIRATRGVRRMLSDVNGRPLAVGDREMDVIRACEAEFARVEAERQTKLEAERMAKMGGRSGIVWHFSAGDIARIKAGPLAGFYAQLIEAVDAHDRIRAIVSLFGRSNVTQLSAFDLSPCLLAVMRGAERLPIPLIPEQHGIAIVRCLVVDFASGRCVAL